MIVFAGYIPRVRQARLNETRTALTLYLATLNPYWLARFFNALRHLVLVGATL